MNHTFSIFKSKLGAKFLVLVSLTVILIFTLLGGLLIIRQRNSLVEINGLLNKNSEYTLALFINSLAAISEQNEDNLLASVQDTGKALADLMAALGTEPLRDNDLKSLNYHLRALMTDKNVAYGLYRDAKNRPLAKAFADGYDLSSPNVMKISVPIRSNGADAGTFELGLSKKDSARQARYTQSIIDSTLEMRKRSGDDIARKTGAFIASNTRTSILNVAVLTLLSVFALLLILSYFFTRTTLSPILALTAMASAVAKTGDLRARVDIKADNELGELAGAFNQMTVSLQKTTVNRDELTKEVLERKKTEAFIKGILESVGPLIVTDKQYRIILANPAFCGLAGMPLDQVMGKPCYEALHRYNAPCFETTGSCSAKTAFETKKPARAAYTKTTPAGTVSYESCSYPLLDNKGDVVSIIQTITDVTEQKNMEARAQQSEKMSALGQLAAGVAHEINNPMGIILGFAQSLAKNAAENDPLKMPLKSIEREAMRCKELVQNLLVFSRSSGQSINAMFNINSSVESALSLVLPQAKMRHVEIVKNLGDPLPMINANNGQLQQVIINLCGNAIDAMSSGGKLIIGTSLLRKNGEDFIRLDVSDTGSGIPSELRSRIFNPFFTTKGVGKGTGLGLSIVHEIVERHAGTIELESKPGKGTKFSVYLPVRQKPPSAA